MSMRTYRSPRREQDAADTRNDIIRAARELFGTRGYARVTVAEIARRAGVAPKTVYASAGGKASILMELLAEAVAQSGATENLEAVRRTTDPAEAVAILARGTRIGNETHQATVDMLYTAMAVHDDAETLWAEAIAAYRSVLRDIAVHLRQIGGLADGLTIDRAVDILWFCFGTVAWRTLVKDCGWTWDEAERWLAAKAATLLESP
jgi:AcrR family transcriptional regulator